MTDLHTATSQADCIFCGIIAGTLPAEVIVEDDDTIAFMDISPATPGHLLVVPRAHARDLLEIDAENLDAAVRLAQRMARRVIERLDADGVNLTNACGARAGQTVFHFHIHVIPRYAEDVLQRPWEPGAGDVASIARTADLLR
jgi:histidine triad (HIT) family protein